jgi:hypothetical protein
VAAYLFGIRLDCLVSVGESYTLRGSHIVTSTTGVGVGLYRVTVKRGLFPRRMRCIRAEIEIGHSVKMEPGIAEAILSCGAWPSGPDHRHITPPDITGLVPSVSHILYLDERVGEILLL